MKNVVTHNGVFHADDVFAVATLQLVFGVEGLRVTRTRDPKVIETADIVIDVGAISDPSRGRFDHHQKGRAGARASGVLFSSFGLVWAHYGETLCDSIAAAAAVDRSLVAPIDATDNGQSLYEGGKPVFVDVAGYSVSSAISSFNPTWLEEKDFDGAFIRAVDFARSILLREIASVKAERAARGALLRAIDRARAECDPRLLVLDRCCPWAETVISAAPEALFVVFPSETGTWMVQAVNTAVGSFDLRRPLPEAWAGLRDEEFRKVSGVPDGVFCHPGKFICGAETREGALRLAELALQ